jgi:hypothetical protein
MLARCSCRSGLLTPQRIDEPVRIDNFSRRFVRPRRCWPAGSAPEDAEAARPAIQERALMSTSLQAPRELIAGRCRAAATGALVEDAAASDALLRPLSPRAI